MLDQLYTLSPWAAYGMGAVLMLVAAQVGHRVGRSWRRRNPEERPLDLLTLEGAVLGLLALMIGFTFSMAMTRHEHRLSGILQEANAIGTAALRAEMLPQPYPGEVKKLLRDYVQVRLDLARSPPSAVTLERAVRRSNALQLQIWRYAAMSAAADPHSVSIGLFVRSLNAMIDLQEARLAAGRNHIPNVVYLLLYAVAATAVGFSGYVAGLANSKGQIPVAIVAVLIAAVIGLIGDFDRSSSGFVIVSQQSMLGLKESLDHHGF